MRKIGRSKSRRHEWKSLRRGHISNRAAAEFNDSNKSSEQTAADKAEIDEQKAEQSKAVQGSKVKLQAKFEHDQKRTKQDGLNMDEKIDAIKP